jgi:hypothetical protein
MNIILCLIKHLSPSENDEQNSALEDLYGTECQCSANCFQNKKFPDCNEIKSLRDKLELAINERLLTAPAKNVRSLENMVKKEIRFFEDEGIRWVNLQLVYDYLSTIALSSTEPDRALSATN